MTSCLDSELGLFESSLLLERGLSRNTCTAYISDLRDFGAFLAARGVASVAAITRDDIVAFLSALRAAGRAERTRARRTAAIRSFLRHLAARGTPVWIRYVLVPGLTDGEDDLRALGGFLRTLPNVRRLDILPYHTLGVAKWRRLGIPYSLDGIAPPDAAALARARAIIGARA